MFSLPKRNTVAHLAVLNNDIETIILLLEKDFSFNKPNIDKITAYDLAKQIGNENIIKLLESAAVNPSSFFKKSSNHGPASSDPAAKNEPPILS